MMVSSTQYWLDRSVRGVMGVMIADFRKGIIDDEDIIEFTTRRANAIRAAFREVCCRPASAACTMCDTVLSETAPQVVVGGNLYCAPCGAAVPRHKDPREETR